MAPSFTERRSKHLGQVAQPISAINARPVLPARPACWHEDRHIEGGRVEGLIVMIFSVCSTTFRGIMLYYSENIIFIRVLACPPNRV